MIGLDISIACGNKCFDFLGIFHRHLARVVSQVFHARDIAGKIFYRRDVNCRKRFIFRTFIGVKVVGRFRFFKLHHNVLHLSNLWDLIRGGVLGN